MEDAGRPVTPSQPPTSRALLRLVAGRTRQDHAVALALFAPVYRQVPDAVPAEVRPPSRTARPTRFRWCWPDVLDAFWQAVGGRLADRWVAVSVPALVFWLGGLAAWIHHRGGPHTVSTQTGWLERQTAAVQTAVILTVVLAVAVSGHHVTEIARTIDERRVAIRTHHDRTWPGSIREPTVPPGHRTRFS